MDSSSKNETRRYITAAVIILLLIGSTGVPRIVGYATTTELSKRKPAGPQRGDPHRNGVRFDSSVVDLGVLASTDKAVRVRYTFANRTGRPIRVRAVVPNSDCIESVYTSQWVGPNMQGAVILVFDPRRCPTRGRPVACQASALFDGVVNDDVAILEITANVIAKLAAAR